MKNLVRLLFASFLMAYPLVGCAQSTSEFDLTKAKVGDVIAGFTVYGTNQVTSNGITTETVKLSGKVTFTADRTLKLKDSSGEYCLTDKTYRAFEELPHPTPERPPVELCFSNGTVLQGQVDLLSTSMNYVAVVVDDLEIFHEISQMYTTTSYTAHFLELTDYEKGQILEAQQKQQQDAADQKQKAADALLAVHEGTKTLSPNKKRRVWVETIGDTLSGSTNRIVIANENGSGRKVYAEKKLSNGYYEIVRWNQASNGVFFTHQPDGVGSVANYGGYPDLSYLDLGTGTVTALVTGKYFATDFVTDISANDRFIASVKDYGGKPTLHIFDRKTKRDLVMPAPKGYDAMGNAYFSPDSKKIAYNISPHSVGNEDGAQTVLMDISGKNKKVIIQQRSENFNVTGWSSNTKILLKEEAYNGASWTVNSNGSGLKKR